MYEAQCIWQPNTMVATFLFERILFAVLLTSPNWLATHLPRDYLPSSIDLLKDGLKRHISAGTRGHGYRV